MNYDDPSKSTQQKPINLHYDIASCYCVVLGIICNNRFTGKLRWKISTASLCRARYIYITRKRTREDYLYFKRENNVFLIILEYYIDVQHKYLQNLEEIIDVANKSSLTDYE